MNVRGELVAVFNDESRRKLNFKGYIEQDQSGMSDVEVQTLYDAYGNYIEFDNIEGFEILNYRSE